jgi:hypothetical protein
MTGFTGVNSITIHDPAALRTQMHVQTRAQDPATTFQLLTPLTYEAVAARLPRMRGENQP